MVDRLGIEDHDVQTDFGGMAEEVSMQDAVNESQERLRNLINW